MKVTWLILALYSALSAADKLTRGTVGKTASIPCGAETAGKNNLEWKRHGEMVLRKFLRRGFQSKGTSSVSKRATLKRDHLEISKLEEGDLGRYICLVDGKEHAHMLFIMSVWVSPPGVLPLDSQAKLQCRVEGLQPLPTLEWTRPDRGPGGGSGEVVLLNPVARTHEGSWACEFSQDGETFRETLTVQVQGPPVTTPPLPASPPSKTHCSDCTDAALAVPVGATVSQPGPMLLGALSLWVWVGIGVVCCFILLLVVVGCVITLHYRDKRKRRKKKRRKKTFQRPLKPKHYCQCDRSTGSVDTTAALPRTHSEKPSMLHPPPRQQP